MKVHRVNDDFGGMDVRSIMEHIESRRKAIAAKWNLNDEIVLIFAGAEISIPGRGDQTYPFRSHSEYFYLTDDDQSNSVLAYDPKAGFTTFHTRLKPDEAMWYGAVQEDGEDIATLQGWIDARKGRKFAKLGQPTMPVTSDENFEKELREQLNQVRRPKDAVEMDRMRVAAAASQAGFAAVQRLLVPGKTEREIQIELEAEFFRNGGQRTAYDTIVGGGPNSAVLHFSPTLRAFKSDDLILIDAGAEYRGYASDVTRTYSSTGFTPMQRDIYSIVLEANVNGIEMCRAGVEYKDVHLRSALDIARGLVDLKILKGNPESLVEQGSHALFFPHGVGHLVGLGVRDASGYMPGRKPEEKLGLRYLRIDLPLLVGYTVTIEPGIYFIPVLLQNKEMRAEHKDTVNWEKVDTMLDFGGIRIEDNVHVTPDGPEVLTKGIPKEMAA